MRQPHEPVTRWLGDLDTKTLIAGVLAVAGALGWLHDKWQAQAVLESVLQTQEQNNNAEGVQLRADVRELRTELSSCRGTK